MNDYLIIMIWSDRTRMFHMNETTRKEAVRQAEKLWIEDNTLIGIELVWKGVHSVNSNKG